MRPDLELKEGWVTVVFLLLLLLCVAWSLQVAKWTTGLSALQAVVLLGGVLGILLGKSRLPSWMAHLLGAVAGFAWVSWFASRALAGLAELGGQQAVLELDLRLQLWVLDLARQGTSQVSGVFLMVIGLLMWLMAYFSAWAVFRWQRVWWAIVLCGLAVLLNYTLADENLTILLLAFLLLALLLVVRTNLASYQVEWRREQVQYNTDLTIGFLRAGLAVSLVAIALAWLAPGALASDGLDRAWRRVSEPWQRFQDIWSEWFQDVEYENQPPVVYLERTMRFGGPVRLTDRPIMDVRSPSGRYWRTAVYHEYLSTGWANTDAETLSLPADDPGLLNQPLYESRGLITQTVTVLTDFGRGALLPSAGEPYRVSLPVQAAVSVLTDTVQTVETTAGPSEPVDLTGVSMLNVRDGLLKGSVFGVVSSVSSAGAAALKEAGTDYPSWVVPRYLQLPDTLPDRVGALAEQIAADLETPYEKVVAVESYLRRIPYNQLIQGPGPDQDGVDYFLFEEREGYCAYYASAMVVMLRAVGVPARYAEGYHQDRAEQGVHRILERDGHAWPEVFFPGYGWLEFEPTASKPLNPRSLVRSGSTGGQSEEDPRARDPREFGAGGPLQPEGVIRADSQSPASGWRIRPWVWGLLGGAGLCAAAAAFIALRRRRLVAGMTVAERVYFDLESWARRLLRVRPLAHQTPHEFARSVATAVPAGESAVWRVADLYVEERFGAKDVDAGGAERAWRELWPCLWKRSAREVAARLERFWRRIVPGHSAR